MAKLLALFHSLIRSIENEEGEWDSLEDLISERADIGIRYAFDGYGISYDDAMELLRTADPETLTDEQKVDRDILVAAVDNIVDFSTAEEYQMASEIPDFEELYELEGEEMTEEEMEDYLEGLFATYNERYAGVENMDIEYSMIVAAFIAGIAADTVLMYMTQGDERVRPWHLQYEGFTAPRRSFPDWLIPPIEHQCRCYLVEDSAAIGAFKPNEANEPDMANIHARWEGDGVPEMPEWFNRTFKESVANGGRIFSDEHPYFQIREEHEEKLREIAERVKRKYFE